MSNNHPNCANPQTPLQSPGHGQLAIRPAQQVQQVATPAQRPFGSQSQNPFPLQQHGQLQVGTAQATYAHHAVQHSTSTTTTTTTTTSSTQQQVQNQQQLQVQQRPIHPPQPPQLPQPVQRTYHVQQQYVQQRLAQQPYVQQQYAQQQQTVRSPPANQQVQAVQQRHVQQQCVQPQQQQVTQQRIQQVRIQQHPAVQQVHVQQHQPPPIQQIYVQQHHIGQQQPAQQQPAQQHVQQQLYVQVHAREPPKQILPPPPPRIKSLPPQVLSPPPPKPPSPPPQALPKPRKPRSPPPQTTTTTSVSKTTSTSTKVRGLPVCPDRYGWLHSRGGRICQNGQHYISNKDIDIAMRGESTSSKVPLATPQQFQAARLRYLDVRDANNWCAWIPSLETRESLEALPKSPFGKAEETPPCSDGRFGHDLRSGYQMTCALCGYAMPTQPQSADAMLGLAFASWMPYWQHNV
ncbi:hypothetical protein LTR95_001289 [Oleoguttula sp. CCFEE 5521]